MRSAHLLVTSGPLASRLLDGLGDWPGPAAHARLTDPGFLAQLSRPFGADVQPAAGRPVVYRLQSRGHRQTGVVVEVPVEDLRTGRVRRHEAVQPERQRRLTDFLAATGLELVPVTLTHAPSPALGSLLAEAAEHEPDVELADGDGSTQTVWMVRSDDLARKIWAEVDALGALYIADGHHRTAAAEDYAARHCPDVGDHAACYVLSALFPSDQMRVLGYHRCVTRPEGTPAEVLLDALARQPVTERVEECAAADAEPTGPGTLGMWLDGRWYRLRLRETPGPADARTVLDVVALEDAILGPVLGIAAPATDPRVTTLPGVGGAQAVAGRCADTGEVGFLLHPPTIEQIMAVADAGMVMPPKSTWFDPKARAGPFVRDLLRGVRR
jgi:uncharacterized protein (DUF1015 family)